MVTCLEITSFLFLNLWQSGPDIALVSVFSCKSTRMRTKSSQLEWKTFGGWRTKNSFSSKMVWCENWKLEDEVNTHKKAGERQLVGLYQSSDKQQVDLTLSLEFSMTPAIYIYVISYIVWIAFFVFCNQTHVPWYASCRGSFYTQAPLLWSSNLDLHKEDQFQMGNKTLAKRKSKG